MAGPIPNETQLTVTLRAQVWQEVINAMGKAPYETVQPLIMAIMTQFEQQQQQQQAAPSQPVGNGLDAHPSGFGEQQAARMT